MKSGRRSRGRPQSWRFTLVERKHSTDAPEWRAAPMKLLLAPNCLLQFNHQEADKSPPNGVRRDSNCCEQRNFGDDEKSWRLSQFECDYGDDASNCQHHRQKEKRRFWCVIIGCHYVLVGGQWVAPTKSGRRSRGRPLVLASYSSGMQTISISRVNTASLFQ